MKKWFARCIVWGLALLMVLELICRFVFGFGDAPLFQANNSYEYIAQPNQHRYRFFCHYKTNSYSQRSEEPDSTRTRVLGLGDSVLYGGTWMDQDSLATTLFSNETGMQMLNISCGSWGPDNCAAYLQKHGTFGASAMILVCSSHDAYDVMTFEPVVGVYSNYPDKQYLSGLWELMDRYVWPMAKNYTYALFHHKSTFPQYADPDAVVEKKAENRQVVQKGLVFNPGFDQLKHIADSCNIPFVIYLHAEKGELENSAYNDMGQEIIHWCDTAHVRLIQGISSERSDIYHDVLHLNERGQRHLANIFKQVIE